MKIRHIIWDWNGTLLNDADLCWQICRDMLLEAGGSEMSFPDFRERFSIPVYEFWNSLMGREIPELEYLTMGEDYHQRYVSRRSECSLHRNVEHVLRSLSGMGLTHSILSSAPQALLETGVAMFGIREYFGTMTGHPGAGGSSKIPLGRAHLKKLEHEPEEMALIGDTVHDFELAQALGVRGLLFSGGAQAVSHLEKTDATVIHEMEELVELISPSGS